MWWSEWEDFTAGLYWASFTGDHVADSVALLSNPDQFYETAREMIREWPNAAIHNLDYMWSGRRSWIGQASCMYAHEAPSAATRVAWGMLTQPQRVAANAVADRVQTERRNKEDHGAKTLFR